jgi:hypothetical protein
MSGKIMNTTVGDCVHFEGERRHYLDKGSELADYYCPSGFRWLTNTNWICSDGGVSQYAVDLIQNCWKFYDSVAVGSAFDCNGSIMHDMIAVYVKKAISVRIGTVCNDCGESYDDKDIVHVEKRFGGRLYICKTCFNNYSYKEITVGNEVVLVKKYNM